MSLSKRITRISVYVYSRSIAAQKSRELGCVIPKERVINVMHTCRIEQKAYSKLRTLYSCVVWIFFSAYLQQSFFAVISIRLLDILCIATHVRIPRFQRIKFNAILRSPKCMLQVRSMSGYVRIFRYSLRGLSSPILLNTYVCIYIPNQITYTSLIILENVPCTINLLD